MSVQWDKYSKITNDIFDAVGRTPLVRLNRIMMQAGIGAEILGKLEYYSPSGSVKDRIYYNMFKLAIQRGELKPGMTILECSTGNAGIACSFVSAVMGYPCIIVMPEGMSEERKMLDIAYGSEMVYTPGGESDVDLALMKVDEIKKSDPDRYWVPAQFDNPDNIDAHYLTTGPEIYEQCDGNLDLFIATQGTGGTITGVGKYLRKYLPDLKLYAVEPEECPLLSKRKWGPHGIEGIGDGFVPLNLDVSLLNGIVTTSTEEALEMAKTLAKEEGIFCGISSGSNIAAAVKVAKKYPEINRIVTMINDSGQRYFSTPLCDKKKDFEVPEREHPMDDRTVTELDKYDSNWDVIE